MLAVTGIGMISSVGRDAERACAAIRAGISRPRALSNITVVDEEMEEPAALIGHPVDGFTDGFLMAARWRRLAEAALDDLLQRLRAEGELEPRFWDRTALLTAVPYLSDDRFQSEDDEGGAEVLREVLLEPIGESLAPGAYLAGLEVVELGHSAAIAAVQRAEEGMARREFDRAIVLAVDSLLDSMTLEWLTGENRVKCDANPTGLAPGEAAACLLLEQPERARGGRRPWMTLRGAALRREKASFVSGDTNQGDALCASIRAARSRAGVSSGLYADIITDQNGENWRASELAYARIKLREELGPGCRFLHPAASIGDTGAASGGVALCFAACAFRRGFARGDSALVLSSTERGDVGAALVGAAE